MPLLLLATRNRGKVRELQAILRDLPVELKSLLDFPDVPETEEDGATLEENALKKARAAFSATGLPSLSTRIFLFVFHVPE